MANAHRDDGKRFIVRADEKLTAFVELEAEIHAVEASGTSSLIDALISETHPYVGAVAEAGSSSCR